MGMKSSVIKGFTTPVLQWKTVPGDPYINGDTVTAIHGAIVLVSLQDPDTLTINLPAITADSAGKSVFVRNLLSKALTPGQIVLTADDNDTIEALSPLDASVYPLARQSLDGTVDITDPSPATGVSTTLAPNGLHFQLESDGVGNWSFILPNGGLNFLFPI